jgi:hypothetical protein
VESAQRVQIVNAIVPVESSVSPCAKGNSINEILRRPALRMMFAV